MMWPFSLIQNHVLKKVLGGWIRHGIGFLGGVTLAVADPDVRELGNLILENTDVIGKGIVASLLVGVPALWSTVQKVKK